MPHFLGSLVLLLAGFSITIIIWMLTERTVLRMLPELWTKQKYCTLKKITPKYVS